MHDSSFGRLIGVLVAPTKTFDSIRQKPSWVAPLVLLTLLSTVSAFLVTQRMDYRELMEQRSGRGGQQMSAEQTEQAVAMMERFGTVFAVAGGLVVTPIIFIVIALIYWGAFRFFGGSELGFRGSFATTVHAMMPGVVSALLTIPIIGSRETIDVASSQRGFLASNLAAFAPEDSGAALVSLLASLDFFSLWSLILFVLGFRAVAQVSTKTAAATVVTLWLLFVGIKVGWAALFG